MHNLLVFSVWCIFKLFNISQNVFQLINAIGVLYIFSSEGQFNELVNVIKVTSLGFLRSTYNYSDKISIHLKFEQSNAMTKLGSFLIFETF